MIGCIFNCDDNECNRWFLWDHRNAMITIKTIDGPHGIDNNTIDEIHPKHYCNPPHNLIMWFGVEEHHAWIDALDDPTIII